MSLRRLSMFKPAILPRSSRSLSANSVRSCRETCRRAMDNSNRKIQSNHIHRSVLVSGDPIYLSPHRHMKYTVGASALTSTDPHAGDSFLYDESHNLEVNVKGSEPLCRVVIEHVAVRCSSGVPAIACVLWNGSSESIGAEVCHHLVQVGLSRFFGQSLGLSLLFGLSQLAQENNGLLSNVRV